MIREVFHSHGIQVSGGLTTVIPTPEGAHPKQRLFDTFCYNDPEMRAKLKEVCSFIGAHFDEFIIDDFFFTDCACESCLKARDEYNRAHGIKAGWRDYRLDLLRRVSEEDIIGPAKKANPKCQIIIKYPNWAESYQDAGRLPGFLSDARSRAEPDPAGAGGEWNLDGRTGQDQPVPVRQ